MMRKTVTSLLFMLGLAACSYPQVGVKTVETRPALAFTNASPTAQLSIDGVYIGQAALYDGKKQTLQLDRGTHKVLVEDRGRILLEQTVYLGDEVTKTIAVPN
ncbi:hypothetical protein GE253_01110 [Niveispirillum sp. SYP-B3756]|uniref:hypothetical protein n=1 Tax=Niveispirillum sp. SYP-B3756 TaxID=2662178 RepID=UPI00129166E1|nr:hypothetical protein [Niveispirillum sp. SYP-B3756]MQP63935.1 hypothetical protein [Niveispirillum sp. SYP-B3756]